MSESTKFLLPESKIPTHWYNIKSDMPTLPPPPLHPGTKQPVGPQDLSAIFPMDLILQEVTTDRWVEIPEEVREVYKVWRPTPLHRARRLEKALDTPAHIYYKYEGTSPVGSHKPNTAVPQAYYNKKAGIKRLATETGAGQWGSSLAMACQFFGLECMVYMVKISYEQKPYRRIVMQSFGADVVPSPSPLTNAGRVMIERDPNSTGSLGIAISEAVEDAASRSDTNYSLGSVLDHVLLHQSVIGLEAKEQMEMAGEYPDVVIGCHGGGSNYAGIAFPFLGDKLSGKAPKLRSIAAEPASCPTLTRGVLAYDFGDTIGMTPLIKMYTLGHDFIPPGIHAGGLRYHGASALVSQLLHDKVIEAKAYTQNPCFEAGMLFARSEGIIPAPESTHAVRAAIDEALAAKEAGEQRVILFNLSGHGNFDLTAYEKYMADQLVDEHYGDEALRKSLGALPPAK